MERKKQVILLRISYWAAAIADFGVAVLVLIPSRMGVDEVVYPMGLTAATVFSWGILLLIADRKPMERRWILIPTILVVSLLTAVRVVFSLNSPIEFSLPFLLFGLVLVAFMSYSYYAASKTD